MNRHERRRREAAQRTRERRLQKDVEERESDKKVVLVNVPDDIKHDISKTVRSIEWQLMDGTVGGMCFYRAFSGSAVLHLLNIRATPVLGGMVYRAGADEVRDVVSYCGPGNVGRKTAFGLLAHYFVVSGDDIIDFSPGDWQQTYCQGGYADIDMEGHPVNLGPVQWMVPPPEFFWAPRKSFEPIPGQMTPELGRAWYTGFVGEDAQSAFEQLLEDTAPQMERVVPHIKRSIEFYALKERVWAHVTGHTAVRMSQLAELVTDPDLAARARRTASAHRLGDKLIVLRGKVDITPEEAASILVEAGI